jgi:hypothetical protein
VLPTATPTGAQPAAQQVMLVGGDWGRQGQGQGQVLNGMQLQPAHGMGSQQTAMVTHNGSLVQLMQQQQQQQPQQQYAFILGNTSGGQAGQTVFASSAAAPGFQALPATMQPQQLAGDLQQQLQQAQQQQHPHQQPAPFQLLLSGGGLGMDSGLVLLPHPATSTTSLSLPGSINDAFSLPVCAAFMPARSTACRDVFFGAAYFFQVASSMLINCSTT